MENIIDLLIVGVHPKSEGYPNTKYRIIDFEHSKLFKAREINFPLWITNPYHKKTYTQKINNIIYLFYSHVYVLTRFLIIKKKKIVYVPYPCVFIAFLISILPKYFQPRKIFLDGFISLYDTMVIDRKLIKKDTFLSNLLWYIEKTAYSKSTNVFTDTIDNSKYYSQLFNIPLNKFLDIPLSTNESDYSYTPYKDNNGTLNILFIGTLVPLHGVDKILSAIEKLPQNKFQVTIIGDGQDRAYVENFLAEYPNRIKWIKEWKSSIELAQYITNADICLGIFGDTDKTQRVLPLKIYAYSCIGRPIITARTSCIDRLIKNQLDSPFILVDEPFDINLAKCLIDLSTKHQHRERNSIRTRDFYINNLSNESILNEIYKVMSN